MSVYILACGHLLEINEPVTLPDTVICRRCDAEREIGCLFGEAGAGDDPVGLAEIAARLRVKRPTVDQWRARGVLPEPTWPSIGGRPAWAWAVIREWARQTGRLSQYGPRP